MKDVFANTKCYNGDFYVGDYTNYKRNHPDFTPHDGVVIDAQPLGHIPFLRFRNRRRVAAACVNFEENAPFFKDAQGRQVKQCECLCLSSQSTSKGWLALVELKYCYEKNICGNFDAAKSQLEKSFLFLRDDKKLFKDKEYHYFWIISMPEHTGRAPFTAFALSQDEQLRVHEAYGAIIIGDTEVEILNSSYLRGGHKERR